jgi:hypothetical protein
MDISFVSADKKKTYCLYEAPNPEAIREAARKLNPGRDYRLGRVADHAPSFSDVSCQRQAELVRRARSIVKTPAQTLRLQPLLVW